ncbi:hypothetical protein NA57DRAFT_72584 [Rhizodiscina lignyota]|uniref:Uncharacterized protein n=1 Tax=Rhizodiscina lignyota TaxID=1504668 RepID=A0A9P4IQP9_9PEZI|nr:hypothetical protein NA57DRAFT_72584 [Rhizodiscina lignyota]
MSSTSGGGRRPPTGPRKGNTFHGKRNSSKPVRRVPPCGRCRRVVGKDFGECRTPGFTVCTSTCGYCGSQTAHLGAPCHLITGRPSTTRTAPVALQRSTSAVVQDNVHASSMPSAFNSATVFNSPGAFTSPDTFNSHGASGASSRRKDREGTGLDGIVESESKSWSRWELAKVIAAGLNPPQGNPAPPTRPNSNRVSSHSSRIAAPRTARPGTPALAAGSGVDTKSKEVRKRDVLKRQSPDKVKKVWSTPERKRLAGNELGVIEKVKPVQVQLEEYAKQALEPREDVKNDGSLVKGVSKEEMAQRVMGDEALIPKEDRKMEEAKIEEAKMEEAKMEEDPMEEDAIEYYDGMQLDGA